MKKAKLEVYLLLGFSNRQKGLILGYHLKLRLVINLCVSRKVGVFCVILVNCLIIFRTPTTNVQIMYWPLSKMQQK